MTKHHITATYKKYFEEMNFERDEVFKAVQQWANSATVLYPGSSIHVTPSFFFQHVVYVDRSSLAQQFFADTAGVFDFVTSRKQYKQSPFIRFIAQDYYMPLPLRAGTFDMLISLYAGGISQACQTYLKPGGILLSNNHHDDAGEAARSRNYALIAVIHHRGNVCQITEAKLTDYFIPKKEGGSKTHIQYQSNYAEYTKNADYYLFQKALVR